MIKKNVEAYREFIIKQLLDEESEMKQIEEEYKQAMKTLNDKNRRELYEELTTKK